MDSVVPIWIILISLFILCIFIVIFYLLALWPFNIYYVPVDPRTRKKIEIVDGKIQNRDWLISEFNYTPYKYSEQLNPNIRHIFYDFTKCYCDNDPKIIEYCNDQNLPIPLQSTYKEPKWIVHYDPYICT